MTGDPNPSSSSDFPSEDVISILVATDNHLGYMEKDPIRGNDSLRSFEEILIVAQERHVDMILLGGDLFHDNKPSRKTLHGCMELLRAYCMGEKPCEMEILSDESVNFPNRFATVNYKDPNLQIGIPVFSIHGNHDDPSGDGNLCALDLLSICGLVNYFGKSKEVDNVTVNPILLQKGQTKLALYGLGNIRDERLYRTFVKKKVKFMRPRTDPNDWFNLFVIHQNRVRHTGTSYVPESFLESFLHLVLWGHEHECLIDPEQSAIQEFYISQPGSSIATSLSEGEARSKHIGLFKIHKQGFRFEKIRLRSVRPFILDEIMLSAVDGLHPSNTKKLNEFLVNKVNALIDEAVDDWKQLNMAAKRSLKRKRQQGVDEDGEDGIEDVEDDSDVPLPLVRLKVEYSGGFTTFNPSRFGQQFVNRVANPKDIIHFYRKRQAYKPSDGVKSKAGTEIDQPNLDACLPERLEKFRVEDLVNEFLQAQNLLILPENALSEAVKEFVEKDDRDIIKDFTTEHLEGTWKTLEDGNVRIDEKEEDLLKEYVQAHKQTKVTQFAHETATKGTVTLRKDGTRPLRRGSDDDDNYEDEDAMDIDVDSASKSKKKKATPRTGTARGRGRGRGRGAKATAGSASKGGRNKKDESEVEESEDEILDVSNDENGAAADDIEEDIVPPSLPHIKQLPPAMTSKTKRVYSTLASVNKRGSSSTSNRTRQSTLNFGASQSSQNPSLVNMTGLVDSGPTSTPSAAASAASSGGRRLPSGFAGGSKGRGRKR
ncbi:Metallo-dependent phosphatase-like protein [Paraphysoderma sedebokerense]|nr:Metallo-dependent phosphatase-like protein [Paraphysoderma sedebokerense]